MARKYDTMKTRKGHADGNETYQHANISARRQAVRGASDNKPARIMPASSPAVFSLCWACLLRRKRLQALTLTIINQTWVGWLVCVENMVYNMTIFSSQSSVDRHTRHTSHTSRRNSRRIQRRRLAQVMPESAQQLAYRIDDPNNQLKGCVTAPTI